MADVNKQQQLSAARKKLREYQKHRKPKTAEHQNTAEDRTPAESLTNSTHSSLNEAITSISPLQNYFTGETVKERQNFFDNISANAVQDHENQVSYGEADFNKQTEDVLSMEYPEIDPNLIYNHLHKSDDNNMEALKQLSTQIIQLIDDTSTSEIQSKNNVESGLKLKELEECLLHTQSEMQSYKVRCVQLEEELSCHQQTVNILVSEKAELADALAKSEITAKSKTTECNELSARLKTSRSRVADLEKELNTLRTEKSKRDNENADYLILLADHKKLKEQQEEAAQDISELREKLSVCQSDRSQLELEVQDLTGQLSLVNVKLQQLSTVEDPEISGRVDALSQRNELLEKQIGELQNALKVATNERDQVGLQYQHYVQELNTQMTALAEKLDAKRLENEALTLREKQLMSQIGELEKLLQRPQTNNVVNKDVEEALVKEKAALEEKHEQIIGERDELFRELESKKFEMSQLEELVEQLRQDQPDNARLLASIESDKVAASRAVAQNSELKKQLEEMQEVFIKMSNDKLELTESLANETHKNKEIQEKLNQFESQIHTLTDAIEIKDREMVSLRMSAAELNKYILQQKQLEDRLRHYEAHDHSTHALQNELQESYKRVQNLKIENEKLQVRIDSLEKQKQANAEAETNVTVDRVMLQNKIDQLEKANKEIELKLNGRTIEDENSMLSKDNAMLHLEEKFTKTMQDIANLQDEKQRLEHLVLQLQSETETIGEYIALYQHQRGVLKQRALEREEQMRQLSLDRESIKNKLDQLNQLIRTLLLENGTVSPEMLKKLCTQHAKMHEEINNGVVSGERITAKTETAEKIIELLGEIKTSNLVQPFENADSFHPCPWCSGQLITV